MQDLVRDLNRLYAKTPALHARDCEPEGFEWLIADDAVNSVFAWIRRSPGEKPVVIISNFTPNVLTGYQLPLPAGWRLA
jgi:1,4-alpha-glucan branching enzyme